MRFNTRSLAISALAALPKLVSSALIPNADTPVFFLVGLDSFGDSLKPMRLTGQHGVATLTGEDPIAQFYFHERHPRSTSPYLYRPYIDFTLPSPSYLSGLYPVNRTVPNPGECGPSGMLKFVQDEDGVWGSGRQRIEQENGCAQFDTFELFSDRMDAQLGAKLIFNTNLTDFYACGSQRDIVYKLEPENMPSDCPVVIQLFTLPVV
ncbi:hypothetical protein FA13DRAFT_1723756 [Coprinellus micaceus]|uniref:Uncharacterized protein n=1 Tax=Coprinellus micaceus TaxID=71717 RepID=A0A4Y7TZD1_COPMI|nr:hypothetical protein FA13DRAFT_1723756 [Coprinellus micaceus]